MAALTTRPVASLRLLDVLHDAMLALVVVAWTVFVLGAVLVSSTLGARDLRSPAIADSLPSPSARIAPEPQRQ